MYCIYACNNSTSFVLSTMIQTVIAISVQSYFQLNCEYCYHDVWDVYSPIFSIIMIIC